MTKLTRVVVLVLGMVSLISALSSPASALTWHNSGDSDFTASSGAGTLGVTGVNILCSGGSMTASSPTTTVVGPSYIAISGSASLSGCTLLGIATSVSCGLTFTAMSGAGSVTSGTTTVFCSVTQFGTEICKIEGGTPGNYTNPVSLTTGRFALPHSSALRTTNGIGGTCPLAVGEPVTSTARTFAITNASGGNTAP